jgi:5-methylcytosine-specific restriction endonuclease McrA
MNEEYVEYLKSDDWKERRKELMEEACYVCSYCGAKATQLHHLNYDNLGFEVIGVDVVASCKDCHKEVHNKEDGEFTEYKQW